MPQPSGALTQQGVRLMEIAIAGTEQDIADCYLVMSQLRPQLDKAGFVAAVRELMREHGYQLVYLKNPQIKAVMGLRCGAWLHRGKYLEIEDLVTCQTERSKGYGEQMLNWAKEYAKSNGCSQLRLVSGVARERAHQFYQQHGMTFEAKYFSIDIK